MDNLTPQIAVSLALCAGLILLFVWIIIPFVLLAIMRHCKKSADLLAEIKQLIIKSASKPE